METSQVKCLTKELGVTVEMPYFKHPITDEPVFAHFDPPHLFKSVRNNLLNYDILVRLIPLYNFAVDRGREMQTIF
jgi:hypothetical protein